MIANLGAARTNSGRPVVTNGSRRFEMAGGVAATLRRAVIRCLIAIFSGIRHAVTAMMIANTGCSGAKAGSTVITIGARHLEVTGSIAAALNGAVIDPVIAIFAGVGRVVTAIGIAAGMFGRADSLFTVARISFGDPLAGGAAASAIQGGIALLPLLVDSVTAGVGDRRGRFIFHFDIG